MIEEIINQAFQEMIATSRIHKKIGLTSIHVKTLRYQIRIGRKITIDKKLTLLKRSGWKYGTAKWTDQDMIDLLKFYDKLPAASRQFGPAYILEKFCVKRV
jgi:hypothetical protein